MNAETIVAAVPSIASGEPFQLNWCGLPWTPWAPLDREAIRRTAPALSGVYRIRRERGESRRLVYIGQTGRTLRERLLALAGAVTANECPFNDPHTAAPHLWLMRQHGARFEWSCAARRGYDVVAFDASPEMVRLARKRVEGKVAIRLQDFRQVAWHAEFDGIWACASLLHVPPPEFAGVASRLAAALCHGGAWYMSFKLGQGERVAEGRLFVDHNDPSLRAALADAPVEIVEVWTSEDVRPDRKGERWINAVARKR